MNWYQESHIQREAGFKDIMNVLGFTSVAGLVFVMLGSSILNAAQKAKVSEQEIQQALNNPGMVQQAQQFIQQNQLQPIEPPPAEIIRPSSYITSPTSEMLQDLIRFEGTIAYQQATGTYKNGKFYPYQDKDSLAIGYGHNYNREKINYNNGITEDQALQLLQQDAQIGIDGATKILKGYNISPKAHQIVAQMVFQMGESKVRGFDLMLTALRNHDYKTASAEMINSEWASETPERAQELALRMQNN